MLQNDLIIDENINKEEKDKCFICGNQFLKSELKQHQSQCLDNLSNSNQEYLDNQLAKMIEEQNFRSTIFSEKSVKFNKDYLVSSSNQQKQNMIIDNQEEKNQESCILEKEDFQSQIFNKNKNSTIYLDQQQEQKSQIQQLKQQNNRKQQSEIIINKPQQNSSQLIPQNKKFFSQIQNFQIDNNQQDIKQDILKEEEDSQIQDKEIIDDFEQMDLNINSQIIRKYSSDNDRQEEDEEDNLSRDNEEILMQSVEGSEQVIDSGEESLQRIDIGEEQQIEQIKDDEENQEQPMKKEQFQVGQIQQNLKNQSEAALLLEFDINIKQNDKQIKIDNKKGTKQLQQQQNMIKYYEQKKKKPFKFEPGMRLTDEQVNRLSQEELYEYFTQVDLEDQIGYQSKIFQLDKKKVQINQTDQCMICLDEILPSKEKLDIKLDCQHQFHYDCIKKWLQKQKYCPICKDYVDLTLN